MSTVGRVGRWVGGGAAVAALGYVSTVTLAWLRYGRATAAHAADRDSLLDTLMPRYEVVERHDIRVSAPAAITLATAKKVSLQSSAVVRAIIRARELALGTRENVRSERSSGLLSEMTALGWRVLAEVPGREVVLGAVTQPWLADVVFRGLPPDEFRDFDEPGYVKIAWTLRADPLSPTESMFRTETRVMTTDPAARRKFRWYWARFSPGIVLIRYALLRTLKAHAERRRTDS